MAGRKLKVAIVTDWLTNMAGAERVVLELHKMFPKAPIFTSLYNPKKMPLFSSADVRPSWLNRLPFIRNKHQLLTIPRQWYFKRLKLDEFDLVISAGGAEAKAARAGRGALHINYCHAPTHYYWVRPEEYLANPGFGWFNPVMRLGLRFLFKYARRWDYLAAQEPDIMLANSTYTKENIRKFYDRDSQAIFPPVDISRFKDVDTHGPRKGFVTLGRQVHYMRRDLAVLACTRLGLPLTVIGNGPEHNKLRSLAGPSVRFVTDATDEDVVKYLSQAEGFIFPGVEDFGIVAVEAMAAGTPVIAIRAGGALDSVVEGKTGLFFDRQSVRALTQALKQFDAKRFDARTISAHATTFSVDKFRSEINKALESSLREDPKN